jgi:hypothetical protein
LEIINNVTWALLSLASLGWLPHLSFVPFLLPSLFCPSSPLLSFLFTSTSAPVHSLFLLFFPSSLVALYHFVVTSSTMAIDKKVKDESASASPTKNGARDSDSDGKFALFADVTRSHLCHR